MIPSLDQFLADYPGMAVRPGPCLELAGTFRFRAVFAGTAEITDEYELRVVVPAAFPRDVPTVYEPGRKIPALVEYHVNNDGSLCLGSPLRLLGKIAANPTLVGFAENCLVPHLYAMSHKRIFGGPFVFGELKHYSPGAFEDYQELFGVATAAQAEAAWRLLQMKEREAKDLPCPCGCGLKVGLCGFRRKLREFRTLADIGWFKRSSL